MKDEIDEHPNDEDENSDLMKAIELSMAQTELANQGLIKHDENLFS